MPILSLTEIQSKYTNLNAQDAKVTTTHGAGGTYSVTSVDSAGNIESGDFNAQRVLTKFFWNNADGTRGNATFNDRGGFESAYIWGADGSVMSVKADGGYDITNIEANGVAMTYSVAANGAVTGRAWTNPDGTYGHAVENGDGTRTSYEFQKDGSYSHLVSDWYGNNTENRYSANNQLTGSNYTRADGSRGSATYAPDGSFVSYDFKADGSYLYKVGDVAGNVTSQWYTADNTPFTPNGNSVASTGEQADALIGAMAAFGASNGSSSGSSTPIANDAELQLAVSA